MTVATARPTLVYDIGESRYINLGDRCTLRCQFCPKFNGSKQVHQYDLSLSERPSEQQIIDALGELKPDQEVIFCGFGEPTLRLKPLLSIAQYLKMHGARVRVNTDGLGNLVHKRNILPELSQHVDALSISLNAHSADVYQQHCQPQLPGSYEAVCAFIQQAPRYINQVTVTAIQGLSGVDIAACQTIAEQAGASFRIRYLDVVG